MLMGSKCLKRLAVMATEQTPPHDNFDAKSSSETISARNTPGHQPEQPKSSHQVPEISQSLEVEGEPAPDTLGDVVFLEDPANSIASKVDEASHYIIFIKNGMSYDDLLYPSRHGRAPQRGTMPTISSCAGRMHSTLQSICPENITLFEAGSGSAI